MGWRRRVRRDKARTELTDRFASLETEFTELKTLEDLKAKFTEIKTTVPARLRGSFANFQEQLKSLAGLTGFKDFVGTVKESLPQKISSEFSQIEAQFWWLLFYENFDFSAQKRHSLEMLFADKNINF